MKLFAKGVIWAVLATISLTSCGGGGSSIHGGVYIIAGAYLNATTYSSVVFVHTDSLSGAPISDATVTVNSQALTYNTTYNYYEGAVLPDAGKFNLSVTASGATYTSTVDAFTTPPVLDDPNPFSASAVGGQTITWSRPVGAPAPSITMFYNLQIFDATHTRVYAGGSSTTESVTIPAGTTQQGADYIVSLYGTHQVYPIANAATGSNFSMQASADQVSFTATP